VEGHTVIKNFSNQKLFITHNEQKVSIVQPSEAGLKEAALTSLRDEVTRRDR
jgi:hypothetical protein